MSTFHIAVLDDDPIILKQMVDLLTEQAVRLSVPLTLHPFDSALELLNKIQGFNFDMLILDRQLPDMSGDEILTWVRQKSPLETIVMMVTSLDEPAEVARMLTLGADDYVTKPIHPDVVCARVFRLIKRSRMMNEHSNEPCFTLYGLEFNRPNCTISRGSELVSCTAGEFALAEYLFKNMGQALSRKRIFEAVWQRRSVESSRALDTQIHRIRSKLKLSIEHGFVLQPIYGVGYRLDVAGESVEVR